ncbi:glutamine--fructose-6-phosphate transaminase (isomerizing) [Bacteroidales bacterium OttesenSCG-928-K03]|nr:glutamine--fructose-6-phosphate transaminase (isomerizing) [Odoribacter sp. OttesenSCG-928-L07]MDL2241055.1 glutamine--fructose-6-phosphate transaminase (isomerizing) [Bacteroidales bacterium OttesenSCG-928-K22]MDL2242588.1 glutamine--fructose-6-phosphate transaminase (isomerizing) [Bacteroidales bacterium OttesenSCG-928-K03]
MCGIVGYVGKRDAYEILIKGLHRLEYRGYDSAGIALISDNNDLVVYKTKGKVINLENHTADLNRSGKIGIAHTRWATHGEPNDINAHPHFSGSKSLALIHNGIIENYKPLKEELIAQGKTFVSDTDTEVLIQLIEYIQESHNCDLFTAVQMALNSVVGAYAIAIINKNDPETMIVARKGSPLIIGIGEDDFFIGSDATPIVEYTDKVIYLEEEQIAKINLKEGLKITDLKNIETTPIINKLNINISQLEKAGYEHFMLKEIFEQPESLINTLKGRLKIDTKEVKLSGIIDNVEKFRKARRIIICACGTSWHAALIGKYIIEELARIPVEVEYSSEFRYRNPIIYDDDIVIAISQSGETADTLAAIVLAKSKGAFLFGICNVVGSSIPRATHSGAYTHVGPEIGVASTKAFTAQLSTLFLIALSIAHERKTISNEYFESLVDELQTIPDKIREILKLNEQIKNFAKTFTYAKNFIYLGRGYNYPVALEGALKLKEISYIHAEGYPAAEMKHGPIALIDEELPVVVIATKNGNYDKIVSNIEEIKARKGYVISIVTKGDTQVKNISNFSFEIPDTADCFVPILSVIPLQLLSYHIATAKNRDVDQPRNLAKSVTVE